VPGAEAEAKTVGERDADERTAEAERQRFLDAIAEGLADADAGRVHTHAEVVARMHARFAARSK
jgi:predicted transcriptional regulator